MYRAIYKYPLEVGRQTLKFSKGYKILSVINQNEEIVLYTLVDPDVPTTKEVDFIISGTGWKLESDEISNYVFLDTVSTHNGGLVWHVFYRKSK